MTLYIDTSWYMTSLNIVALLWNPLTTSWVIMIHVLVLNHNSSGNYVLSAKRTSIHNYSDSDLNISNNPNQDLGNHLKAAAIV